LGTRAGKEVMEANQLEYKKIFFEFKSIKEKNFKIKQDTYPQICGQGSSQTRLIYALNYEKGKLNIDVLEPKGRVIKIVDNYKVVKFSFDLNAIKFVDMMDLHRQTRETVNRDVMQVSLGMTKLQTMNDKI